MLRRLPLSLALAMSLAAAVVLARPEAPTAGIPPVERLAGGHVREAAPTELLVRFERTASAEERGSARKAAEVSFSRSLPLSGLQVVRPRPGVSLRAAIERLERSGAVEYAEPDVARNALAVPDDALLHLQWGLHNTGQPVAGTSGTVDADIDAPEAWDITTGAAGITVAVIDSGVDGRHPDLAPNMWTNPGESGSGREANGIDDDADGYVDDVRGWDFVESDADPADGDGHGTHVAGTIGARGNDGTGVAGVAWSVGLLPLRVLGADGSGRVSDAVAAYALAGRLGIRIVNASLGGPGFSRSERDAIRNAPRTLFVVAAGNDGADNDLTSSYPCNHDLPNVVCVAAVDQQNVLASFSNHGAGTVDLAAPGVNIASTYTDGRWVYLDGTSMATPHVAGAAALVWSLRPDATVAEVRAALLGTTDPQPSLSGRVASGGTLNVHRALRSVAGTAAPAPAAAGEPAPAATPAPGAQDPPASSGEDPAASSGQDPAPSSGEASPPQPTPLVEPSGPSPAPAPGVAPDATAPRVAVTIRGRLRVAALLRRGVRSEVTCSELCTLRSQLVLPARQARALGLRRRDLVVGRGRGGTRPGAAATLVTRVTPRQARRLRASRELRLVLVLRATDAAGNVRTLRRAVRVRAG